MSWYSPLTRLVFNFYREDPEELLALRGLGKCKLSRWWGTFRVNCTDAKTASDLIGAIELLREPIAQLRLAQQVKIMVNGKAVATFPVHVVNFYNKTIDKHSS
ncbi:MAG: hypothetical protein AAGA75_07895 [Cyanobacteria bacterium P01_E01_bin.6]